MCGLNGISVKEVRNRDTNAKPIVVNLEKGGLCGGVVGYSSAEMRELFTNRAEEAATVRVAVGEAGHPRDCSVHAEEGHLPVGLGVRVIVSVRDRVKVKVKV